MVTADLHLARKALVDVSASVHDGSPADAIGDVIPALVAAPSSVDEVSALLRTAATRGLSVVPRGGGSRLGWGSPVTACDLLVDMTRMDRVLEHAAGDLVARVQAGARMGDVAATLAGAGREGAGQEIALDVPADATVGGVIASGLAGPRRLRYGSPRDLLIGVTIVRADGTVAHSGGKVVKNVAGYDLGKLLAGSWGTLGLIAEATFRLHPLPPARAFVTASYDSAAAASRAVAAAAASPLTASAVELRWVPAGRNSGQDDRNSGGNSGRDDNRNGDADDDRNSDRDGDRNGGRKKRAPHSGNIGYAPAQASGGPVGVGVLLEGSAEGVADRAARMAELLGTDAAVSAEPPRWWLAGKRVPDGGTLIGVSFWVSALRPVLETIAAAAREHSLTPVVIGAAGAGVVHVGLGPSADAGAVARFTGALRASLSHPRGSVTVLTAPGPVRAALTDYGGMTGPVPALRLMRAVRDQFDPGRRMSPGRFPAEGA